MGGLGVNLFRKCTPPFYYRSAFPGYVIEPTWNPWRYSEGDVDSRRAQSEFTFGVLTSSTGQGQGG